MTSRSNEISSYFQVQMGKIMPSSFKNVRGITNRQDRSIVYDEEEENELSEDTDDFDENENVSYTRN